MHIHTAYTAKKKKVVFSGRKNDISLKNDLGRKNDVSRKIDLGRKNDLGRKSKS